MEKSFFEQIGGTYRREGDYFLPNLTVPESVSVGVWGQRHLRYIKEYHKALYIGLQLSGELDNYLADIDQQAKYMFFQLVEKMAKQEHITEQLKADNQARWIQRMNSIRHKAEEVIQNELIYT